MGSYRGRLAIFFTIFLALSSPSSSWAAAATAAAGHGAPHGRYYKPLDDEERAALEQYIANPTDGNKAALMNYTFFKQYCDHTDAQGNMVCKFRSSPEAQFHDLHDVYCKDRAARGLDKQFPEVAAAANGAALVVRLGGALPAHPVGVVAPTPDDDSATVSPNWIGWDIGAGDLEKGDVSFQATSGMAQQGNIRSLAGPATSISYNPMKGVMLTFGQNGALLQSSPTGKHEALGDFYGSVMVNIAKTPDGKGFLAATIAVNANPTKYAAKSGMSSEPGAAGTLAFTYSLRPTTALTTTVTRQFPFLDGKPGGIIFGEQVAQQFGKLTLYPGVQKAVGATQSTTPYLAFSYPISKGDNPWTLGGGFAHDLPGDKSGHTKEPSNTTIVVGINKAGSLADLLALFKSQ
jgi:hypothetical protein